MECKVLILDEPTSSLDEQEVEKLFKLMLDLKSRGVGIIFVTHFLEQVYAVCDRITVLRDGKLVGEYKIADLPRVQLVSKMLGKELDDLSEIKSEGAADALEGAEVVYEAAGLSSAAGVRPFDFSIRKGEVNGFTGLLGSGRSESVRAIFGADPIDGGTITIKGKQVHIKTPRQAIQHGIAFLTEDRKGQGLVLAQSIRTNLILANMKGFSTGLFLNEKKIEDAGQKNIASLRIKTPSIDEIVGQLSGGNQQKVVIGKWVNTDADIFIFDEPTRGIDVGAKVEVYNVMNSLVKQGKCVIMVSSEMPEILGMSDRVIVMRGGEVMAEVDRDSEHFNQEDLMKAAWGGKLDD